MSKEELEEFKSFLIKFTLENEEKVSRNWLLAVLDFIFYAKGSP